MLQNIRLVTFFILKDLCVHSVFSSVQDGDLLPREMQFCFTSSLTNKPFPILNNFLLFTAAFPILSKSNTKHLQLSLHLNETFKSGPDVKQ